MFTFEWFVFLCTINWHMSWSCSGPQNPLLPRRRRNSRRSPSSLDLEHQGARMNPMWVIAPKPSLFSLIHVLLKLYIKSTVQKLWLLQYQQLYNFGWQQNLESETWTKPGQKMVENLVLCRVLWCKVHIHVYWLFTSKIY